MQTAQNRQAKSEKISVLTIDNHSTLGRKQTVDRANQTKRNAPNP
jgi:hypothetical protein